MTDIMLPFFKNRYSPKEFDGSPVDDRDIVSLIQAARWAPSADNEQPWRFFVASRAEKPIFDVFVNVLNEENRSWAGGASAVMITAAMRERRRDGEVNAYAWHDLGQVVVYMTIQPYQLGIYLHQIQGFNPERARTVLNLPSGYDPVAAIAIGRPVEGQEELARSRTRVPLDQILTQFPVSRR